VPSLQNDNVILSISATNVNYENDNDVVKTVEAHLRELNDHITFLNEHIGDVGELENAVLVIQNNIPTVLTVEDIKTINPYIGIDEKIFQYNRHMRSGLYGFGVVVQAYTDIATLDLF
jgi:hypothetical protein